MAQKKYVSISKLSTFLDNLRSTFAALSHSHKLSDITDYTVDTALSSTSTNPVQNKVLNEEFDAVADAMGALDLAIDGKADASHTHPEATKTASGLLSASNKIQLDMGGIPIVTTSGTGAAYTATVNGMTLTTGASFVMIPHTVSTTTAPTLNINGLGAKNIRRRLSSATTSTTQGYNAAWLSANKPITVTYDGAFWIADLPKPSTADLSGTVAITQGGTGATDVANARKNLEVYSKSEVYSKTESYSKTEIDNMEFITTADIDTICGATT